MPIVREFRYETWDEVGEQGLRPAWFDNANPTNGQGVAHDILEHFPKQTSALEGECEALGAFVLLRLSNGWAQYGGYLRPDYAVLANDIRTMLNDAVNEELDLPSTRASRPLEDKHSELLIDEALRHVFDNPEKERNLALDTGRDEDEIASFLTPSVKEGFRAWIRRGYRRAMKRYAGCDTYTIGMHLFDVIRKKVDKLISGQLLWEGARVRICVSPRYCDVSIKVFDPDVQRWLDDDELFA